MTTPPTVVEKKPVEEALKNSQEELKHAMLMIQTTSGVTVEQVTAELCLKFKRLTVETATRIYSEASRQLVLEKDRKNATKYFLQEKASGSWPDAYSLQRMFPRLFVTWQEAKAFQEDLMKKYGENNHKQPKAETIPPAPVAPNAPATPKPPATPTTAAVPKASSSVLSNSKPQTHPTTTPTPPIPKLNGKTELPSIKQASTKAENITPNMLSRDNKSEATRPEIAAQGTKRNQVVADITEPIRSPLWRNFNLYADDPRTEEILLENVVTQTFSPRQQIDDEYIRTLGISLRDEGQERAILVTPREGKLLSVSGDCRIEAARKVGLTKLRGVVVHLTDEQAIALGLAANLEHDLPHRPLTAIEEAKVLKKLTEDPYKWTQQKAAEFFGKKDRGWVNHRLELLNRAPTIQEKVQEGKLTERHVRSLTGLPEGAQEKVADKIAEKDLSVRQTEDLTREIKARPEPANVTPEEMDAMLAKNREEINKSMPIGKALQDAGAVRLHKDTKGIYFFTNTCPVCGNEHNIDINFEEGFALLTRPKDVTVKTLAGGKAS